MRKILGSLVLAATVLVPGALLAHEGHRHVMGTVTAVDATHVEIQTKDGKSSSVPLSSSTKYYKGSKGKTAGAASAMKVGTRVMIDLAKDGSASEVRLPAGRMSSSHKM
ncbi:MAG: hypothetical protein LC796_06135 [Acidobacteria bacterium]|nr:hypothetical protein [Acidobacteriota bacterium]MCA1611074.1 hypothetical protein [Acidobacteriota bacterium]